MSALARDETSVFRRAVPGCVLCGRELRRADTGRRRLYCDRVCRQRAHRLRHEARHRRGADAHEADPAEVTRLLAAVLRASTGR